MHHYPKIQYGGFAPTVIKFPYPPTEGTKRETFEYGRKITESLNGTRQVQLNFTEATRKLKFRFLTEADIDALESFFHSFAAKGKAFKYFEDDNSSDFFLYELDQNKLEPKIHNSNGPNSYLYEVDLALRRVVDAEGSDGYMQLEIENGAGPIEVEGLIFDENSYRSAKVFYEIWRKTDAEERVNNGELTAIYKDGAWDIAPGSFVGDPAAGVTFQVSVDGQLSYLSDEMAGANYQSEMLLRNFTIIGG